ncbi:lysoplasmalogenase family protein [Erythrobacter sp. JK5]|uniref:lysoplasmalogenase family protein n=1 Tax=Erythrobacter sp. JK5 TaxID=2829500 RepID=UPI001BA585D5|nr:lysoplasmalogenase family protein [Erythrobacter sp. JK5]QUL38677.1 lysoplasmalogenase [Erythrobacter sp. JK5]
MPKRALVEHRPWILASLAAATVYYLVWDDPIGELYLTFLKGAGVGLLAVYAMRRTSGFDGAILVIALALAAAADMVLIHDFRLGGALFLASHIAAIVLYLRNLRPTTTFSQKLLAAGLLVGAPAIAYLLSLRADIALYAVGLGAMAATAWMSRFSRYRVGLGAVLFVISDWLIFSREGPIDLAPLPNLLIWPLYYIGQLLIATGIVQTLRADHEI